MKRVSLPSLTLAIVALLPLCSVAQQPKYDAPAPPLAIELLQAPTGTQATWESLRGLAVVIEFWATWCPGCIAQIDHLNELASRFQNRPVRFISITDEDSATVHRFLGRKSIAGWVALDATGATFRRYGIEGRPQTAVVDAQGVLRGIIPPTEVTESTVEALLDRTLRLQAPAGTPSIGMEPNAPVPIVQVTLRPALDSVGMSPGAVRHTGNKFEAWGLTARQMLAAAYQISELRILAPDSLPNGRYDISILLPDNRAECRDRALRQLVEAAFGVTAQPAKHDMDVFVLRKRSAESDLRPLDSGISLKHVANRAEAVLKCPVVDETGLTGKYDFALARTDNREVLLSAVAKLGLELLPARRQIDVVVVKTIEQH